MARGGAQTRRKRTREDARRRRRRAQSSTPVRVAEKAMFFPRLRRQAKWVFVFLALVFAVGFVIFGVGSGGGVGLGDLFNNNSSSSKNAASESDARKKIKQNPKDAAAYRELATALSNKGDLSGAIAALRTYTRLRPKDVAALNDLAGFYTSQGTKLAGQASAAQTAAAATTAGAIFGPLQVGKTQLLPEDVISSSISQEAQTRSTDLFTAQQNAFKNAENTFQQIVKITPKDATAQLNLGQAAEQAGDTAAAISAYTSFVKLAPNDSTTPIVKQRIKQLLKSTQSSQTPPVTVGG
jgi:cytochrome c-type biogenesis protein CcmH/NrfG